MFSEFSKGDTAKVSYSSKRSGNVVSRKGTVRQTPHDEKKGFFVRTDDNQLTGVMGNRVYSLTIGKDDSDELRIQRKTYVGEFKSVE